MLRARLESDRKHLGEQLQQIRESSPLDERREGSPFGKREEAIFLGHEYELEAHGCMIDVIPLPHPSGASTWHRTEPGIRLLHAALALIAAHPAWKAIV